MALVKFGGGIIQMVGSIAGNTFFRTRAGNVVRAKTKPVNPNTERQSRVRGLWSVISRGWFATLSLLQREDWAQFGANAEAKNGLGETIRLSGFSQYQKSNMAAQNAGLPAILDGPSIFTLPGEDPTGTGVGSEATQTVSVTFDDTRDWVNEDNAALIVQIGLPQDDSIAFFNGPWRHAGIVAGNLALPETTPAAIPSPYNIVEAQKIFVRTRVIRADGRLSDWFQFSLLCGA